MSVYVVFQWSIRPEKAGECDAALEKIVDHIRVEHASILGCRTFKQWTGPQPRRGYTWMEEYESVTAIDQDEGTPVCLEVWKPVEAMADAGTFTAAVWLDAPDGTSLTR